MKIVKLLNNIYLKLFIFTLIPYIPIDGFQEGLLSIITDVLPPKTYDLIGPVIEDIIKNGKIKITKLAQGLPVGGEIEQLDDGTLFSAFKNRVPVTGN